MPETSEEIAKLISKSTDLISYFSTAKEHFEAEINKLRDELNQLKSSLVNEAWKQAALVNGWVNYEGAYNTTEYFKDKQGVVHLKGLIKLGTAALIFTLPSGYRPAGRELHVVCTHPNIAARIDILPDGQVVMVQGDAKWISLDGITFRAA